MIIINLLGAAKKLIGESTINLEKDSTNLKELLEFLKSKSNRSTSLDPENILIAINGVESSSLCGNDTVVRCGDVVTVVTVVHGGKEHEKL
jgi:sulfur-carrier protein